MNLRVRHCVECPKCLTRYLVGLSPYHNGGYLRPFDPGFSDEWTLHCACGRLSRWTGTELTLYVVSSQAYGRGYGSPEEILPAGERLRVWR